MTKTRFLKFKDFSHPGEIFQIDYVSKKDDLLTEKRRRQQLYYYLDYSLSAVSWYDFFSFDTLKIIKLAKRLAFLFNKSQVTGDLFLFPFFFINDELKSILYDSNIDESKLGEIYKQLNKELKPISTFDALKFDTTRLKNSLFKFLNLNIDKTFNLNDQNLKYSYDSLLLFDKTTENVLERFKTPVVTPESLLVTLLEEKETKAGKILEKLIPRAVDYYVLRFKLLKRIHHEEVCLRNEVKWNQRYFGYLLKTKLSTLEFNNLIDLKLLNLGTSIYRTELMADVKSFNLQDTLDKEVFNSIKLSSKRVYTQN